MVGPSGKFHSMLFYSFSFFSAVSCSESDCAAQSIPDIVVVLVVGDYGSAEFNGLELDNGSS